MRRMLTVFSLVGSPAVTIAVGGAALFSYLTRAVWSGEAFAWMAGQLRENLLAQALAALFVINIAVRFARAARALRGDGVRLLLRLPLLLGIVLFLCAFLLSNAARRTRWMVVGLDDMIDPGSAGALQVVGVNSAMDEQVFSSETSAGIFRYEPSLVLRDRAGRQYRIGAYPPGSIGDAYLHVLNFGIGPGVELTEGGKVVSRGHVALRLLPFGNVDSFTLPPSQDTFYLSILPVQTKMRGDRKVQEYDLRRPRYRIEVVRGDRTIFSGEGREGADFDAGRRLSFFEPSPWVQLEIVRDPFLPLFAGGLLLTAAGAVLYPFSWLRKKRLSL